MNTPRLYKARNLRSMFHPDSPQSDMMHPKHGWIPARCLGWPGLKLLHRIKLAWGVFTAKYDVIDWEDRDEAE